MGLLPNEFYDMTLYEYRCYICRHKFEESRKWEHTRMITYTLIKVNGGAKDISIQDFRPLLTDPEPLPVTKQTKAEIEALRARAQESVNRFANAVQNK